MQGPAQNRTCISAAARRESGHAPHSKLQIFVGTIRLAAFRFQSRYKVSTGDPAFVRVHDHVLLTAREYSRPLRQKRT
jgi:hypothetical protein